jgi:hypothetical protein
MSLVNLKSEEPGQEDRQQGPDRIPICVGTSEDRAGKTSRDIVRSRSLCVANSEVNWWVHLTFEDSAKFC